MDNYTWDSKPDDWQYWEARRVREERAEREAGITDDIDWADYYPTSDPGCTVVPWAHLTDTTEPSDDVPF